MFKPCRFLLVLATYGCAEDGPSCTEESSLLSGPDERGAVELSLSDALAGHLPFDAMLVWGPGAPAGLAGSKANVSIDVVPSGDSIIEVDATQHRPDPQCDDRIESNVRVHLKTADGVLDGTFDASLQAWPQGAELTLNVSANNIAQDDLGGSITFDTKPAYFALTMFVMDGEFSGYLIAASERTAQGQTLGELRTILGWGVEEVPSERDAAAD